MILAKFTEEEANNKSMQQKVSRDLHQKTELKGKADATVALPIWSRPSKVSNLMGAKFPTTCHR